MKSVQEIFEKVYHIEQDIISLFQKFVDKFSLDEIEECKKIAAEIFYLHVNVEVLCDALDEFDEEDSNSGLIKNLLLFEYRVLYYSNITNLVMSAGTNLAEVKELLRDALKHINSNTKSSCKNYYGKLKNIIFKETESPT